MNFRTIGDLNSAIYKNLQRIPQEVDLVVGIPRSGMLAGSIISLLINEPLADFNSLLNGDLFQAGRTKRKAGWISDISEARKILVVEDSSSTGKSISEAREKLENFQYKDKIVFLTIYVTEETRGLTDIWFEVVDVPRMFEWNYLHHSRLDNMCFDIDGVLCEDPTPDQNDDGEKYIEFIRNAPVKVVPTYKIGYLVTSRLEKYRDDTDYWLKKNGIQYGELIMMPYASKEERLKHGSHGIFKGENYKRLKKTYMFVESEARQAEEIARVSGKTVFCTENQRVYTESNSVKRKEEAKKTIKKLLPPRVKSILKRMLKK
nr:phosphoribosyltransferase family protein [Eisenbergiella porci]